MSGHGHHLAFDIGCVMLSEYDSDGFLGVQYDAEGENDSGVPPYEVHTPGGLLHRPLDPDVDDQGLPNEGQAANVMFAMEAGKGHAFVLEDPRVVPNLPLLQKGETIVHSDFGSFTRYFADGSIVDFTTTKGGDPTGVQISDTFGPDGWDAVAPWGRASFDQYGWRVQHAGGASINVGSAAGLIPGLASFICLQAGMIELDAACLAIGPTGVPAQPVAWATPLVAILTQLLAALTALGADLATATGAGKASVPLISNLQGQVAGWLEAISSQTAIG